MFRLKEKIRKKIIDKVEHERWVNTIANAAAICNQEAFASLKNIYKGKSVVVCGAGPSLQKYIPIDGAIHVALNRALLCEKVKFDYFFADDWEGINFIQEQIVSYDCKKFMGFHFGPSNRRIPEAFIIDAGAKKYYTDAFMFPSTTNSKLVVDIDRMAIANTHNMGIQVMQIILFMNPSKVYLAGIDASANGHFSYEGLSEKMKERLDDDLKRFVNINVVKSEWQEVLEFRNIYYPNTQIISINPVGLKGIFIDKYQENVSNKLE